MLKFLTVLGCVLLGWQAMGAEVLIVADEFPAMEVLAAKLKAEESIASRIVAQTNLPGDLSSYAAVIVYIHLKLNEPAEKAFIDYTAGGGKLIVLHHSISSGKRKNKYWFKFLGVDLPEGDVSKGGYKWIEGVTIDLVNLAPGHFITTNKVNYPAQIPWRNADAPAGTKALPGFTLSHSEVYLNHVLTEPRRQLLGIKFTDAKSGTVYMQDHAGWIKPSGKGWIVYLLPGHSARDFEDATYGRLVVNAVVWKP